MNSAVSPLLFKTSVWGSDFLCSASNSMGALPALFAFFPQQTTSLTSLCDSRNNIPKSYLSSTYLPNLLYSNRFRQATLDIPHYHASTTPIQVAFSPCQASSSPKRHVHSHIPSNSNASIEFSLSSRLRFLRRRSLLSSCILLFCGGGIGRARFMSERVAECGEKLLDIMLRYGILKCGVVCNCEVLNLHVWILSIRISRWFGL